MTGRSPEPTAADIAAWRRLVRHAQAAATLPIAPIGDLAKAAKSAHRAIVLGALTRENPCIQLVRTARKFVEETQRGRRELAPTLQRLAEEVATKIAALSSPPPDRRFRADLDG